MLLSSLISDLFDTHPWCSKGVCDSEPTVNNWLSLTSKLFCLSGFTLLLPQKCLALINAQAITHMSKYHVKKRQEYAYQPVQMKGLNP